MRLFQNFSVYPSYLPRVEWLARKSNVKTFIQRRAIYINDRSAALHLLEPVLRGEPSAFYTCCNDETLQRLWAGEHGLPSSSTLEQILLAQIEAHRTEVFYNLDPFLYPSSTVAKLPSSVKTAIAWRAAPSGNADFTKYSLVVCNFPSLLEVHRRNGCRVDYFAPAVDPVMRDFGLRTDKPIDVLFVGGFSRHHSRRARFLSHIAESCGAFNVAMHLDVSRLTRLAESTAGRMLPLGRYRRPPAIQSAAREPIFGLDLYEALSRAKIVLNGAIDMAGKDRGNLRCFEALGCGSLMLSDEGDYPEGFVNGSTMLTYRGPENAVETIRTLLGSDVSKLQIISRNGFEMAHERYSKSMQWARFLALAS